MSKVTVLCEQIMIFLQLIRKYSQKRFKHRKTLENYLDTKT